MDEPKSLEQAITESTVTDEERAALGGEQAKPRAQRIAGAPDWLIVPDDLRIPPGAEVRWMRFRAGWTEDPSKGDRQCILWSLTDREETQAAKRARGDRERGLVELSKGTVRAVDGHRADWSGAAGPGSVDRFWTEVGPKCRQMLLNDYFKTSALNDKEQDDFFQNCYGAARAVPA